MAEPKDKQGSDFWSEGGLEDYFSLEFAGENLTGEESCWLLIDETNNRELLTKSHKLAAWYEDSIEVGAVEGDVVIIGW